MFNWFRKRTKLIRAAQPLPVPPVGLRASWYASDIKPSRFREILKDPVFLEGLAILAEESRYSQAVTVSPAESHSAKLGWQAGYADALTDIRTKLTQPDAAERFRTRGLTQEIDEEPWDYISPS